MVNTRFVQAHREARWAFGLAVAYLLAWVAAFCCAGHNVGSTGLPVWFEWIGLRLPLLFMGLCAIMVRYCFHDLPLEP